MLEIDPGWPQVGSKLVWTSGPAGRGRVTERVRESGEGRFATQVFEDRLTGTQTALFEPHEEGSMVAVELEYELQKGGRLRAIADALFIRRALRDALRRTLRRFATEAEAETAM